MLTAAYRFKVDENMPTDVAAALRAAGYEADTVDDEGLKGTSDDGLWRICQAEHRTLVTLDVDWSDVRRFAPETGFGIVLLRGVQGRLGILRFMERVVSNLAWRRLHGRLWIVNETKIRLYDA